MNIVFTFLCAGFYNCHHPLGFLKGEEFLDYWSSHNGVKRNSSACRLFVSHVFELLVYKTQTNNSYQFCAVQSAYNRCLPFHMMTEGNRDLCGDVTELYVLCGR